MSIAYKNPKHSEFKIHSKHSGGGFCNHMSHLSKVLNEINFDPCLIFGKPYIR